MAEAEEVKEKLSSKKSKDAKVSLDSDDKVELKPLYSPPLAVKVKQVDLQGLPKALSKLALEDILVASDMTGLSTDDVTKKILERYNKGGNVCFVKSAVRGTQINRGEFLLARFNNIPELAGPSVGLVARRLIATLGRKVTLVGKVKQNDPFYGAEGSYVLNIPAGKYAKAWSGNVPKLYGPGTHVIHDPTFKFNVNDIVDQNMLYINHGQLHILRVPAGQIVAVEIGSLRLLLEFRLEPYIFDDPMFKLSNQQFNSTAQLIVHGSIKRIIPKTGQVAISYDNGNLVVFKPNASGIPIVIDSPTHEVVGFISTAVETVVFPSPTSIKTRQADNPKADLATLAYEVFITKDSLKVGVKLLVAYQIIDPLMALTVLRDEEGILKHIENLAVTDMGKAIQQSSSQEFLSFYQTQPKKGEANPFTNPNPILHYQDIVKKQLADDLKDYGISLIRLNIETPKIMDAEIIKSMEKQSILSAEANAREGVIEQNYRIQKREAEQAAEGKRIAQSQLNDAKVSQAEAEFNAAKLRADASLLQADAERKIAEMKGLVYQKNPEFFQLELARIQASVFERSTLNLTDASLANMFRLPQAFFGGLTNPNDVSTNGHHQKKS